MKVYYNFAKLFKILIDRKISKQQLAKTIGVSPATISRLSNNQQTSTNVLFSITDYLECSVADIVDVEIIHEEGDK